MWSSSICVTLILKLRGKLFSSIPGLRAMISEPPQESEESYDPRKREPQFAHASCLPLWELVCAFSDPYRPRR